MRWVYNYSIFIFLLVLACLVVTAEIICLLHAPTFFDTSSFLIKGFDFDYGPTQQAFFAEEEVRVPGSLEDKPYDNIDKRAISTLIEQLPYKYGTIMPIEQGSTSFVKWLLLFAVCLFFAFNIFIWVLDKKLTSLNEKRQLHLLRKFLKLEEENKRLSSLILTLKDHENKQANILEKIFPQKDNSLQVLQEVHSFYSEELIDNFKAQIKQQIEKKALSSFSLRHVLQEIKDSLSYKITDQDIRFKIQGKDIAIQEVGSSLYFILYYIIKKIIKSLPQNGRLEIILKGNKETSKIILKDNGYLIPEEEVKHIQGLLKGKKQEFPIMPPYEDIHQVAKICGWTIKKRERQGDFNITQITLRDEEAAFGESNVVYLRNSLQPN